MNRLERLEKMLADDPKDSFVRFAIAMEHKNAEDYDNALIHFKALRANDPEYVGLYYHLAKTLEENEENEKAIAIYDEGIKMAQSLNDQHAKSELMNAKMNLEIEM